MLPGDWASFDFTYTLDMPRLVPHLLALEAGSVATRVPVLPPHWLDPPQAPPTPEGERDRASSHMATRETSNAWAWVQKRFIPGSAPLVVSDILAIHKMVSGESGLDSGPSGAFRTVPVRVGRPRVGGWHEGAPAEELPTLMEKYITFIHAEPVCALPPIMTALLAHFFLATIHPFLDGNGRTSRLIAAAILSRRGYRLLGSHALVQHFYDHALRYHLILHRSWQRCPFEVTPFVAFGVEGVIAELRGVEAFLRMKRTRPSDDDIINSSSTHEAATQRSATRSGRSLAPKGPSVKHSLGLLAATLLASSSALAAAADFSITADPVKATVITGAETRFTIDIHSVGGFDGWVQPQTLGIEAAVGAIGSWSVPAVKVPAGGAGKATFTILTLVETPPGEYPIVLQGISGSVVHQAAVTLSVAGPPKDAITAVFGPDAPVVGVTGCAITGKSSRGEWVTDLSTFPDGSIHSFTVKSNGAGSYTDGPFVLRQLGTYHDVLIDTATGGRTSIAYHGVGDFTATIEEPKRTVVSGEAAQFLVTFSSLSGFVGIVHPTLENPPNPTIITATWSASSVSVRPGSPASSRLTIKTNNTLPPATLKIHVEGINGSVTRVAPEIVLTVVRR